MMTTTFYPAAGRGQADYGWLKARYSFSFSQWYHPQKVHFGALRVLNDDIIAGGGGFPTHPHDNMEIITIPLEGALSHQDSTGGRGTISQGDIQIMSAGTGVEHSEFNASATEPVNLLQLWIFPKERNILPRYDQKTFDAAGQKNQWQVIVSPAEANGALWINQDAQLALTRLDEGQSLSWQNHFTGNGQYLFMIDGNIETGGQVLERRDAIGITGTDAITIKATKNATVLLIELPV
jgi:quercetin 2,3-dioxygenase